MSSDKDPISGRIFATAQANPLQAVDALRMMVTESADCFRVWQQEKTKRARLDAYEKTEIKKIKEASGILRQYFDSVFAERKDMTALLFERYDQAMRDENPAMAQSALQGVIEIAKSSPLGAVGDLGKIREALDSKDHVWEL